MPIRLKPGATWRGLSMQLFALVILPFAVLALAATLMSLGLHQNAMRTMVAERDSRAVETAANFLESRIQAEQETVSALAMQMMLAAGSDVDRLEAFVHAHGYSGKQLAYVSDGGEILAFSGSPEVQKALPGPQPASTHIAVGEINGAKYLWLTASVEKGGRVLNIVPLDELARAVLGDGFRMEGDAASIIMAPDGEVLVSLGETVWEGAPASHPGVSEALRGESGFTYVKAGRTEHVVAYSPVSPPGWALLIEEPWDSVDTPYLRLTQFAPLVLLPVLAFTLVALWFSITQVVSPLQRLETQAAELAWGNFAAIEKPAGGVSEIRKLQNELIHMAGKVQDAQKSLHDFIGAMTRGQEDERRRLARELHDETLQSLIALHQRVQLAQMKARDEEMRLSMNELEALSSSTIEELRRLTRALRPIYLEDFGLVTALEMLARETGGLDVEFSQDGTDRRLDPAVELTLFRIAQEALNNVTRHAEATRAQLRIHFQAARVTLEINDNGKGFAPPRSPAEFAPGGHYGLLGMYERAELIAGKLSIESAPGRGTTLRVSLTV